MCDILSMEACESDLLVKKLTEQLQMNLTQPKDCRSWSFYPVEPSVGQTYNQNQSYLTTQDLISGKMMLEADSVSNELAEMFFPQNSYQAQNNFFNSGNQYLHAPMESCHNDFQIIDAMPIKVEPQVIPPPPPMEMKRTQMECFSSDRVADFKHLIYNLLVENFNNPKMATFVQPFCMELDGVLRQGFKFNESENPDKRLPELYAQHIRKANLHHENQNSIFIQDLYKYYLRSCVELLSKYFQKVDKYTFLYDDIPLFLAGGNLDDAEDRISKMGTIQRRHKRNSSMEDKPKKGKGKHKRGNSLDLDYCAASATKKRRNTKN